MRILITGCTAMQVNSPRKVNDLISNLESIKNCLTALGHMVEWRAVNLEEDLSDYDIIFVSLAPFASWGTKYMGACLVAMANYPDKIILTADDWQVKGVWKSCQGMARKPEYKEKTLYSHWPKATAQSFKKMSQMVARLSVGDWEWPTVLPCHDRGDHSILGVPARDLRVYDPSPFMKRYQLSAHAAPFGVRDKKWICASLTNKVGWLKKQYLKWPVDCYGNVRQGQQKLPENQLGIEYCKVWGVLSPRHNISGAGWFRVRYWMAADAGAIVAGDPVEGGIIGTSYTFSLREIQSFSEPQLEALHAHQVQDLRKTSWTLLQSKMFFRKLCSNK